MGIYVQEKQTINNSCHYTIIYLKMYTTVITTNTKLQSIHCTHPK